MHNDRLQVQLRSKEPSPLSKAVSGVRERYKLELIQLSLKRVSGPLHVQQHDDLISRPHFLTMIKMQPALPRS